MGIKDNTPLTIYGDGHQIRDYVWIEDVINIIEKCIPYDYSGTFEVGTGIGSEIWDIVNVLNKEPLTISNQSQQKEIRKSVLKNSDINLFLMNNDFYNFVSLKEGVEKLWKVKN